jgi:hypothetical protein
VKTRGVRCRSLPRRKAVGLPFPPKLPACVDKGTFAEELNTTADDIEFGITRLPRGTFKAAVHIFRGGGWWPPDAMLCASELEAMMASAA